MAPTTIRAVLLAALATAVMHAQAPPPMPAGTNVLLGRVVEVGTDRPVGGAMVTLTGHFDPSGKPSAGTTDRLNPMPSLNVMTTAEGYFVFRNLPAGGFTTATRAYGYVNNDYPPMVVEIRDNQKPPEPQLRVWKYAAIGGRVVDEHGDPLTGIVVTALRRAVTGSGPLFRGAASGLTDDRGIYRLAQLEPGDYTAGVMSTTTTMPASVATALDPSPANRDAMMATMAELRRSGFSRTYGCPTCVSNSHEGQYVSGFVLQRPGPPLPVAPDGRLLGFMNTLYGDAVRPEDATIVSLGSGESRADIDLALRLVPTMSVSGVLTGPDGPMTHVTLNLSPPGADLNEFDPAGVARSVTDDRGAFMFLAVAPGEYRLSTSISLDANETTGQGRPFWMSQSLSVGDTGVSGLAIVLQPGVQVSGTVEFRTPAGVTSRPTQRQVITLQPLRAELWRTLPAIIQPDGSFRSAGDPPGRYLVNASSPPGWFWQSTAQAGKPVLDEVIELNLTELSGLVLTFGQTTNRVSGRVTDANGAADPGVAVIVFPADSTTWREGLPATRRVRKVLTTSTGSYDIATLAAGDYYIAAVDTARALYWRGEPELLERLIPVATKVTIGVSEEKSVALRTVTLAGR
jgi:protocatechuate 3,4-dioxygenase beta subunit